MGRTAAHLAAAGNHLTTLQLLYNLNPHCVDKVSNYLHFTMYRLSIKYFTPPDEQWLFSDKNIILSNLSDIN